MKLLLIVREHKEKITTNLLLRASEEVGIDVVTIDPDEEIPVLDKRETFLLYPISKNIRPALKKIYNNYLCYTFKDPNVDIPQIQTFQKTGIPHPRTIRIDSCDPKKLQPIIEELGGLPVIVKHKLAGGHGLAIFKCDSLLTLLDLTSYLFKYRKNKKPIYLQKYIPHESTARFIVLGNQVIDSLRYCIRDDDFRSNAGEVTVVQQKFGQEIENIAIKATRHIAHEFGGVDAIIDQEGKPWVTEVNYPCYFPRAQNVTGVPIAKLMIEYLMHKAKTAEVIDGVSKEHKRIFLSIVNPAYKNAIHTDLQKRCTRFGVDYTIVHPKKRVPALLEGQKYLLYPIASQSRSLATDIFSRYHCASLADDYSIYTATDFNRNKHYDKMNMSFIKKFMISSKKRDYLDKRIAYIRFPMIIKVRDKKGTDYFKPESLGELLSIIDFLKETRDGVSIQSYIDTLLYGRLVVLGKQVIASVRQLPENPECLGCKEKDLIIPFQFEKNIEDEAIKATQALGLDFAGVNIQIDRQETCYIDDVYFPFEYQQIERATGISISDKILEHLFNKSIENIK